MVRKTIKTSKENLIFAGATIAGVLLLSAVGTLSISSAQFEIRELEPQQQLEERQQSLRSVSRLKKLERMAISVHSILG